MSAEAFNPSSDLTSGVGTSLYLAPETMERRKANDKSNRYTDKVSAALCEQAMIVGLKKAPPVFCRLTCTPLASSSSRCEWEGIRKWIRPPTNVFYDRCWPIKTRMERIEILKALRRPEIVFPSGWDESDPKRARQGKIIRWCLSHDPVKRAGPLDLLRSDLLPAAVQDEYITDALALIGKALSARPPHRTADSFHEMKLKPFRTLQLNPTRPISRQY